MLTIASRLDVMNRLGRAMADPTRSRILMTLLDGPSYPAVLAQSLDLTRSNVDPHLAAALEALVHATLAVDENAPCIDTECSVPDCGEKGTDA